MKISLASDHAGYDLKCTVKDFLVNKGHDVVDYGTNGPESVDYSDFIYPAALALASGEVDRAVLIDGAGYPSAAIANMLYGVSAAVCFDTVCAKLAREHSNTNALCLGGKLIGSLLATEILDAWLNANFLGGKYARRADKVKEIEKRHLRPPSMKPRKVLTLDDLKTAIENRESVMLDERTIITPNVMDAVRNLR